MERVIHASGNVWIDTGRELGFELGLGRIAADMIDHLLRLGILDHELQDIHSVRVRRDGAQIAYMQDSKLGS